MAEQAEVTQDVVAKVREKLQAQRERIARENSGQQDVAEPSSPQTDVAPDSSPDQGVEPESPPGAEEQKEQQPSEPSDKELNFKRLREERDRERRQRENLELELSDLRRKQREEEQKAKERDRFQEVWQQIQGQRPDDFEEWDQNKQATWIARQAVLQGLDEDLGIKNDLRQMRDESRIVRRFPNLDDEQVERVLEIYQSSAGALNEKEAYEIAKHRDPDLFAERTTQAAPPTAEGTVPPSHQVMEPSREGVNRAPPDEEAELNTRMRDAFEDSPGFLTPDKRDVVAQRMKQKLLKRGFMP